MSQPAKSGYTFGEFSLDIPEKLLRRNGQIIALAPKVFDTLVLLVENAGHLVEKDEFMERLWPGVFVGEDALARNISILRKALGGTNDSQPLIATVPTRGYRFEAAVRESAIERKSTRDTLIEASESAPALAEALRVAAPTEKSALGADALTARAAGLPGVASRRSWRGLLVFALLALALGTTTGLLTFRLLAPTPLPKVIRMEQLTHSGRVDPWPRLVTDGVSIYFLEREGDHWNLMQVPVSGGESRVIRTPFKNAVVLDVSPDRQNLLMGSFEERESKMPLWIRAVSGGALRRVGDITAYGGLWHPNGREILYSEDDGVYICDADGANTRKFITTGAPLGGWSWSPDGKILRFTTAAESWEADANGRILRRLPRSPDKITNEFDGAWSSNGRYFFLDHPARRNWRDIWAVRKGKTFFGSTTIAAVELTNGPMSLEGMTVSRDGHKLFVVGFGGRGDVVHFDPKSGQATSLLAGSCTSSLVYSPNGQWLLCESPDEAILRMRPDGSEKITLSAPSMEGYHARWSPDGKQIAFTGFTTGEHTAVFVASADGGVPRKAFAEDFDEARPTWSPDGKLLAFERAKDDSTSSISILDLAKNQLSILPGSEGMGGPAWSPDGRFLAASASNWRKVMLYDFRTRHWRQLAEVTLIGELTWSANSKCLYFQDILGKGESLNRVCLSGGAAQVAVSFEPLLRDGVQRAAFNAFAPDGSLIVSVNRGGSDIYALDLDLP